MPIKYIPPQDQLSCSAKESVACLFSICDFVNAGDGHL